VCYEARRPNKEAHFALHAIATIDPRARVKVLVEKKSLFLKSVCVFAQIGVRQQYKKTETKINSILKRLRNE
jgi:hypothetical protein